jgi:acyl-CoA dehydrogenase
LRSAGDYEDIRGAVRALCAGFPDEYFRKIDAERAYPGEFVDALTKAGWLEMRAALSSSFDQIAHI